MTDWPITDKEGRRMNAHEPLRPYTIAQLAERWQTSRDSVERLIKSGKLPCLKLSQKTIRIPAAVVEDYERTAALVSSSPETTDTQADPTSTSDGPSEQQAAPPEPSASQQKKLMKR